MLIYDDDYFPQGYSQIKETYRAFTKDDILQHYISDNDFRSYFNGDDIGYNLHVYDIKHQKISRSAQPNEVEIEFSEKFPVEI